jgi:superfamily I DNA/RNA helicase
MHVADPYETAKHEYLQVSWRKCFGLSVHKTPWYVRFEKEKSNACDFDDLLIQGLNYVSTHDIRKRFGGIFVDEFQDLNTLMYQIIGKIVGDELFVIGDPLQSIYEWRDAHPGIFDDFRKDFDPVVGSLIHDHRHGKEIVDVLEWFYPRGIIPCGPPARVEVDMCMGANSERRFVSVLAKELGDSDILCRTWKPLLDLSNDIPCEIMGDPENEADIPPQLILRKPIARLHTIHGSKGATYPNTIVMGAAEGVWPYHKSTNLDEEERLFYVAISRARDNLFITHQGSASGFFFNHIKRSGHFPCKGRTYYVDDKNEVRELRNA